MATEQERDVLLWDGETLTRGKLNRTFKDFAFEEPKPGKCHFNVARPGGGYSQVPLCGATSADGSGFAKGRYTTHGEQVTCKRCLKTFEKQADEIVRAFLKEHPELAEV